MSSLDDYLFALDPAPDEVLTASGLVAFNLDAAGTGVCGVTTPGTGLALPLLDVTAAGDWRPLGVCPFPMPQVLADGSGWHPAWGGVSLPLPTGLAAGSVAALAQAVLPPLFALSRAGATGGATVELVLTAVSGLERTAQGTLRLPPTSCRGHVCSLDSPAGGAAATSDAVAALLCQGDPDLGAAVAGIPVGDPDAVAAALLALVAGRIAYVADAAGDVWTCAAATLARGSGDCEDGAVLLTALLLAAGLPAERIVTAFGRVGVDRAGHAWVAWRRIADGKWVVLDWTLGAGQGAVTGLPVLGEPGPYAWVDYALTAGAFFTVRQEAGVFFARALGQGVMLPALAVAASGSFGAAGAPTLPAGLTAWGLCGATGLAALAGPSVSASGRFGWSRATLAALVGQGNGAAAAGGALTALAAASLAGGGGLAAARLARPDVAGLGFSAAVVVGACRLVRLAGAGRGLAGGVCDAGCALARPRLIGLALDGKVGQGGAPLPAVLSWGLGQCLSLGNAAADLDQWRAVGRGRAADNGTRGRRGNGEEWA